MLRAADDFVLDVFVQINKEGAVACYTDYQAAVLLRMKLCPQQSLLGENVELNMHSAQGEVGTDQSYQILTVFICP